MLDALIDINISFYKYAFINIYIYIYIWRKIEKNKVVQTDEFIVKASQHYNISVLINHHQDFKN